MSRHGSLLRFLAAAAVAAVLAVAVAGGLGLRWNATHSYPAGLWRTSSRAWTKSDLVFVDVPAGDSLFREALARGYLRWAPRRSGCAPLLKRVVAVEGDRIELGTGVSVNGTVLRHSTIRGLDSCGRRLTTRARTGTVSAGMVWLMSDDSDWSYDSRYVGELPTSLILGRAEPLWIWR